MKSSEIKELTQEELMERLESEESMLVRMKMNHAVSPLDNPNKIIEIGKNARVFIEDKHHYIKVAEQYLQKYNMSNSNH